MVIEVLITMLATINMFKKQFSWDKPDKEVRLWSALLLSMTENIKMLFICIVLN